MSGAIERLYCGSSMGFTILVFCTIDTSRTQIVDYQDNLSWNRMLDAAQWTRHSHSIEISNKM